MRVLVTGATGRVGREVLAQLAAFGGIGRALVRNPLTAQLPTNTELSKADFTIPETLDDSDCMDDVDAVFLVWTAPPATIQPVLDRMLRFRLGRRPRIVFLSSPYKTAHPFFQAAQPNPVTALHQEIERLIQNSGCEWTFLRPGMFSANALWWWAPQIRNGLDIIRWPYADARTAPIDERDIAAVAVRALCEIGHAGADYVLTGPESLSQAEQVEIIGQVIGRPLRLQDISPEEARREMFADGPPVVTRLLFDA